MDSRWGSGSSTRPGRGRDLGATACADVDRLSVVPKTRPVETHHPILLTLSSLVFVLCLRRQRRRRLQQMRLLETASDPSRRHWSSTRSLSEAVALLCQYVAFGLALQASVSCFLPLLTQHLPTKTVASGPRGGGGGGILHLFRFLFLERRNGGMGASAITAVPFPQRFNFASRNGILSVLLANCAPYFFSTETAYRSALCAFLCSALFATIMPVMLENNQHQSHYPETERYATAEKNAKNSTTVFHKAETMLVLAERIAYALSLGTALRLNRMHLLPLVNPERLTNIIDQSCASFFAYCVFNVVFPRCRCRCRCRPPPETAYENFEPSRAARRRRPSVGVASPAVVDRMGALAREAVANLEKRKKTPRDAMTRSHSVNSFVQYGRKWEDQKFRRTAAAPGSPYSPGMPPPPLMVSPMRRWSGANHRGGSSAADQVVELDVRLQETPSKSPASVLMPSLFSMPLDDLEEQDGNDSILSSGDGTSSAETSLRGTLSSAASRRSANEGKSSSAGRLKKMKQKSRGSCKRMTQDLSPPLVTERCNIDDAAWRSPRTTTDEGGDGCEIRTPSNPQSAGLTPIPAFSDEEEK